jgi:hypothetical protein
MANRNWQKRRQNKKEDIPHVSVSSDGQESVSTTSADEIEQIFFGKGTEELTDKVVEELVSKGWEKEGLIEFQKKGFRYNCSRDTLFDPDIHSEWY